MLMNSPVKPPAVGHSITWGLFGHKLWETGMARIQEASGRAAGSSLVLAAAAELEGWLLLQQCPSVRGKGGGVWSDSPAKLLLSHLCRCTVTCGSGHGC